MMSGNATLDYVQQECIQIAEALESFFTPRKAKLAAATVLRNTAAIQPHCGFCGTAPGQWRELYTSPIKPNTWICDSCAMYVAIYLTSPEKASELKHEQWLELKDLAP